MTDNPNEIARLRRKFTRWAAALGVMLGLLCGALPPQYHHACNVLTQIAGFTCGGVSK